MLLFLPPALVENVPPPAAPARPAVEREITLPGFNDCKLQGSLLEAEGSGYFAVLVAGAGPSDRDWFSPALQDLAKGAPLQSHSGRDLARWLAGQGIGSLRYDKRFIGRKDPTLNVSLDAQVGDLRAVLAFLRKRPETLGKKLLLIGHDEGALLALMAAGDADALLLLAMPPKSQAASIRDQMQALIPPAMAGPDLAYLDAVFEAIRKRQALPLAGEAVHPFMVALGKSLMAPETLDFVRSLLDLDPWVMAARLALPTAAAWGDRDIQTPPPTKTPATFRGTVLELPGANHLLKRESRLGILRPQEAVLAYGDDTPLADLTPIATWLKTLK